jgi:hypothetical protein
LIKVDLASALKLGGPPMSPRSTYLRSEADKCRQHANKIDHAETREQLRKLADKYIERAEAIENKEEPTNPRVLSS